MAHWHIDKTPGWRCGPRKTLALAALQAGRPIDPCSRGQARRNPGAWTGQNANWNALHYVVPVLPLVKARQVVSPHEPNKPNPWIKNTQGAQGFGSVACPELGFEVGHRDTGVPHDLPGGSHPARQGCGRVLFQRIAGRHQPPELIQPEPFERCMADIHMPLMGGIKGPSQQTNCHAGAHIGPGCRP